MHDQTEAPARVHEPRPDEDERREAQEARHDEAREDVAADDEARLDQARASDVDRDDAGRPLGDGGATEETRAEQQTRAESESDSDDDDREPRDRVVETPFTPFAPMAVAPVDAAAPDDTVRSDDRRPETDRDPDTDTGADAALDAEERRDEAARTDEPTAEATEATDAEGSEAPPELRPGQAGGEPALDLWSDADAQGLRERWRELQLRFIDDPQSVVREAEALVEEAVNTLAASLSTAKGRLSDWRAEQGDDTERLRAAVRQYRDFLNRLLDA